MSVMNWVGMFIPVAIIAEYFISKRLKERRVR